MNVQLGVVSARSTVRNLKELADGQLRVLPYGVFSSFFYLGDVSEEQKKTSNEEVEFSFTFTAC